MIGHILVFLAGTAAVVAVVLSATRTVVMPHGRGARLAGLLFRSVRHLLALHEMVPAAARRRHRAMSMYAPVSLILLPLLWLSIALVGFTAMFWGLGSHPLRAAFKLAGSSMLTLGFANVDDLPRIALTFAASALVISVLGLLLVTYLPSMYEAYTDRETTVTSLETVAGTTPRVSVLLIRHHQIGGNERMVAVWRDWRGWFTRAQNSHTALPAVVLFRSGDPDRNWLRSVQVVLDAASLHLATAEDQDAEAAICIRAGYLSLRAIADFYDFEVDRTPKADDPISVTRAEFDAMLEALVAGGVPLPPDRDEIWRAWAGWRVNYDQVLRDLADLTGTDLVPPS